MSEYKQCIDIDDHWAQEMLALSIIDIFDDFLKSKGVVIPNDEKDGTDEPTSNFYGSDFDYIMTKLGDLIENSIPDLVKKKNQAENSTVIRSRNASIGMPNEVYRLRLDHHMIAGDTRIQLDEPLVVQLIIDRSAVPVPICLNRMMDDMKAELLRKAGEQNG